MKDGMQQYETLAYYDMHNLKMILVKNKNIKAQVII
jgi:hypothetical protein